MTGEKDLNKLLRLMSPKLLEGEYAFCTDEHSRYGDYAEAKPIASFVEDEGLTLVLSKDTADKHKLKYEGVFKCITLTIHSSLEAVGFLAAVSARLSEHHISTNVMAGYYHDHIFVQAELAEKAMNVLSEFISD